MVSGNETDDQLYSQLPQVDSRSEALRAFLWWWRSGENYKLGAKLLATLGRFGAGDPEIIGILEERATGNIVWTKDAALSSLNQLAEQGDDLAIEACKRCQSYWLQQQESEQRYHAYLDRQRQEKAAERLGLSLEAFQDQERASRKAAQEQAQRDREARRNPGDSRFQAGQKVRCLIAGWQYFGEVGTVEDALNKNFVRVTFADGYTTIQSDHSFEDC